MNVVSNAITAVVTLFAVLLGGWLSTRTQDRHWWREHARQWRDVRLDVYRDFLTAYREYVAFTRDPAATISAVPHPTRTGTMMPFFDATGRPYAERMEATKTSALLVAECPAVLNAVEQLVRCARHIAAARATHGVEDMPGEKFQELWAAERKFLAAARREIGLHPMQQDAAGLG